MTMSMIKNLKYYREVEGFNENSMQVYGWIKHLLPPAIIPKSESKQFAWGGSLYPFEFTKLTCLILKGLTTMETTVHLTTLSRHYNKLIVYACVLLYKTNLIRRIHHKPTTLDILNECNSSSKGKPPYNVYVLAARAHSCISYFLDLVQFSGILRLFEVFLPNICEGKQLKQIHPKPQHLL